MFPRCENVCFSLQTVVCDIFSNSLLNMDTITLPLGVRINRETSS